MENMIDCPASALQVHKCIASALSNCKCIGNDCFQSSAVWEKGDPSSQNATHFGGVPGAWPATRCVLGGWAA